MTTTAISYYAKTFMGETYHKVFLVDEMDYDKIYLIICNDLREHVEYFLEDEGKTWEDVERDPRKALRDAWINISVKAVQCC